MCKRCLIFTLLFLFIVIGAIFFIWNNANGQTGSVVINEIAWMGTTTSASDEWIELYNTTSSTIDLSDWALQAHDGIPQINLQGMIPANRYFLLERTDDSSVPTVPADQIYTGALKNAGEILYLYDANNALIDEVDAWHAGNNSTKQTMERKDPAGAGLNSSNWASGPVGGTPKAQNSSFTITQELLQEVQNENLTQEQTSNKETEEIIEEQVPQFIKTKDVIINEFLPNPAGDDIEGEWIEIYNASSQSYDISNWSLDDKEGGSSPFIFIQGTIIAPNGYLVFARSTTKISMANTGDAVRLLYPDGATAYEVEYNENAKENYSYALINNEWTWTNILTPGSHNIQSLQKSATPPLKTKSTNNIAVAKKNEPQQNEKNKIETLTSNEFSAQLGQKNSFSISTLIIFIAAALISALAGFGFVLLKNKSNQEQ